MPIGSILGGIIGQGGQNTAAGMASAAGNQALAFDQSQKANNTSNYSPWTSLGVQGAGQYGALLGYGNLTNPGGPTGTYAFQSDPNAQANAFANVRGMATNFESGAPLPTATNYKFTPETAISNTFAADPSYAWRMQQGAQAQEQSAASRGMSFSGEQAQALQKNAQDMASQEYGNWFNRLQSQDTYNTQGNLATNNQNFGQQQTIYGDQNSAWNTGLSAALGLVGGASQQGLSATNSLAGTNAGLTTNGNNSLLTGQVTAGQDYANGSNALAAGIKGGVNSLASLGGYALGGGLGDLTGGAVGSVSPSYASNAWTNALANSPGATTGPSPY